MKKYLLFFTLCLTINNIFGQTTIDVAESTLKVSGMREEIFYYGFDEGDQILFNFEEINGKELKEIEITEYPTSTKFMDYKSIKITNKIINVTSKGIYKFRFTNSAISGRICKYKIQRIPLLESGKNFNTSVHWNTFYDTTWITKTRQIYVRTDTIFDQICSIENQIWLNSRGHSSCMSYSSSCTKNKISLKYQSDTEELLVYIVADQKTADAFNSLAKTLTKAGIKAGTAASTGGGSLLIEMFTDNATDAAVDNLPTTNSGNKIDIFFTDKANADIWYVDSENRINTYDGLAFKSYVTLKQRFIKSQFPPNEMYLCLKNNNAMTGIPVYINIVAKRVYKVYKDEQYKDPQVTSYQLPYLKN